MNEIVCDLCNIEINNYENDLFHVTASIDGELNSHTHICANCYNENGLEPYELERTDGQQS
jgi:hypothetical protein